MVMNQRELSDCLCVQKIGQYIEIVHEVNFIFSCDMI